VEGVELPSSLCEEVEDSREGGKVSWIIKEEENRVLGVLSVILIQSLCSSWAGSGEPR
jgi:hypothetical protein